MPIGARQKISQYLTCVNKSVFNRVYDFAPGGGCWSTDRRAIRFPGRGDMSSEILMPMVRRLDRLSPLGDRDRQALIDLPFSVRTMPAGAHLVRDGEPTKHC